MDVQKDAGSFVMLGTIHDSCQECTALLLPAFYLG
mgnify:CR=1 FL=1